MYNYEVMPNLQRILKKLSKKDKALFEQILNKVNEIINLTDVEHYKNLKYDLSDYKGVHVGHFVLVFKFEKINSKIKFEDFNHHDILYKKKQSR